MACFSDCFVFNSNYSTIFIRKSTLFNNFNDRVNSLILWLILSEFNRKQTKKSYTVNVYDCDTTYMYAQLYKGEVLKYPSPSPVQKF